MRVFGSTHTAAKGYVDGTHRTRSPAMTLAEWEPRMLEFGVTRLADVTGLDHIGVPVYMAVRPASRGLSVAQGKGLDHAAARASALMEAIESWHAERVEAPLRYDSYASLRRTAEVADIERLPLRRNARPDPTTPHMWIEGYDLLEGAPTWVPFECVTTNFVDAARLGGTFVAGSNGLASGNHLLEALLHALCEVLERDACSRWEIAHGPAGGSGRVDLRTVGDPSVDQVLALLSDAQVDVAAWDATPDAGVPTFTCQISDATHPGRWMLKGVFGGQGCHLSPTVALLRALTEAVQSRLTRIVGTRDDMFGYALAGNPDDVEAARRVFAAHQECHVFPGHRDLTTDTFEGDVERVLVALRGMGVEQAIVVDLGKPNVRIPVVKVVVPGLLPELSTTGHTAPRRPRMVAA